MDYQQILNILLPYWGIAIGALGFGVYSIYNWQTAKKIILSIMLQLEKEAESLCLSTGDAKFQFLLDKGYQMLPYGARMIISPAIFQTIAQNLYDDAKKYLVKYVPTTPVPVVKEEPEQQTV